MAYRAMAMASLKLSPIFLGPHCMPAKNNQSFQKVSVPVKVSHEGGIRVKRGLRLHADKTTAPIVESQEWSESAVELKNPSQTSVKSLPSSFTARYSDTEPRKGADVIVEALEREGVEHVFAYPGGASMEIHQALTRSKTIKNVLCRQISKVIKNGGHPLAKNSHGKYKSQN